MIANLFKKKKSPLDIFMKEKGKFEKDNPVAALGIQAGLLGGVVFATRTITKKRCLKKVQSQNQSPQNQNQNQAPQNQQNNAGAPQDNNNQQQNNAA